MLGRVFRCAIVVSFVMIQATYAVNAQGDQLLGKAAPSAEAWFLPTTDRAGELFVYELGTGTPVVVLHGGPGADLSYMLPIAEGLESEFRFIFYDQRGSLRSRVPANAITMAAHVGDLEALRQALGFERINILSHSAGTLIAFEYLTSYPQRVENLVLVGALPHKNGKKYFDAEYATLWSTLADDFARFRKREAVLAELRSFGSDAPVNAPKQQSQIALIQQVGAETFHVERWREALPMRVNPDAARATRATTNFEYNYAESIAKHPYRITVINGEFDYTVGPRGSPLWKKLALTSAQLSVFVIPDASHIVWRDDPVSFRSALRRAVSPAGTNR